MDHSRSTLGNPEQQKQTPQQQRINLKIQSVTKTKRLRDLPTSFEALKQTVEALVKDERSTAQQQELVAISHRDYSIRYLDPDNEMINVSDDEDLLTAYDVAEHGGLQGNLKFVVEFKKPYVGNAPAEKLTDKKSLKAEKKRAKKMKKQLKKSDKVEDMLGDLAIDEKDVNQEDIL